MKSLLISASILVCGWSLQAAAQSLPSQQKAPNMPPPASAPAEKFNDQDPEATGSSPSLSDKLQRSDGVIRPPDNGATDMKVPAPVQEPGTTPVIPPPGSSGGDPALQPR